MEKYYYDEEVDILYVSFAEGEKATAAVELNDNILLTSVAKPPLLMAA